MGKFSYRRQKNSVSKRVWASADRSPHRDSFKDIGIILVPRLLCYYVNQ